MARICTRGAWIATVLIPAACAVADISFTTIIDDPFDELAPWAGAIRAHVLAAGQAWSEEIEGDASIEVLVKPGPVARATGRSLTSAFVGFVDGKSVFEQGAAAEIRTSVDPNGTTPDVEIVLNPTYVADELWFDPNPAARLASVPADRTDAMSVFIHELGHALAYNGWNDGKVDPAPNSFKSTWDCLLEFNGQLLVCRGPVILTTWGSEPETTFCHRAHWGNESVNVAEGRGASDPEPVQVDSNGIPLPSAPAGCCAPIQLGDRDGSRAVPPASTLIEELMNGVVFYRGRRYWVSSLDRAVLRDVGFVLAPIPIECLGDADQSGMVDFTDISSVLEHWIVDYGAGTGPGDADGNGLVNFTDIAKVLQEWLSVCP